MVWTDVVQGKSRLHSNMIHLFIDILLFRLVFLMFAGLIVVMARGFYLSGGIDEAFKAAARDNRIQFFK